MKIVIVSLLLALNGYAQGLISLKKNKELIRTYEDLTGIRSDSEIQKLYQVSFLALPKNGHVSELTDFTLVGMANLTHAFCHKMIEKDRTLPAASRWVHGNLDLEKEVTTWNDQEVSLLINQYSELFWGQTPKTESENDLKAIFAELSQEAQPLAQSATLSSVCIAMLMSPLVYTK